MIWRILSPISEKMTKDLFILWFSSMVLVTHSICGCEFSFEIPNSNEQCYHENLTENMECRFDYRVNKMFIYFILHL